MLEVLQFIFSSFWTVTGTALLLVIICEALCECAAALRGR